MFSTLSSTVLVSRLAIRIRLTSRPCSHITTINKELGTTILLVEQNAQQALRRADRAYILEIGKVVKEAKASDLLNDPAVREAYLGTGAH